MEERITVKQALERTISLLKEISVPVGLMQQIGEPISAAIGNLMACINAQPAEPEVKDDGNNHAD